MEPSQSIQEPPQANRPSPGRFRIHYSASREDDKPDRAAFLSRAGRAAD